MIGPVWIDLANSPHVHFFAPVVRELRRRGHSVVVTARDYAQTVAVSHLVGIDTTVIGKHGGSGLTAKAATLMQRTAGLCAFANLHKPSVAVSHNSYAQVLAAWKLGLPSVTAMDYEFQPANHLAFRLATLVAVPDLFPLDSLKRQGARPKRTWRYQGLKEHIALADFSANRDYLEAHGVTRDRPVVVVRPPADAALYHRFENPLFDCLLRRLSTDDEVSVMVLPRTESQGLRLMNCGLGHLVWRGEVLDGPQLVAGADAVISAGGSMNREAAVLGTPAFSIYAGRVAAVDRALVARGRLRFLASESDVDGLRIGPKQADDASRVDDGVVKSFVDRISEVAGCRVG